MKDYKRFSKVYQSFPIREQHGYYDRSNSVFPNRANVNFETPYYKKVNSLVKKEQSELHKLQLQMNEIRNRYNKLKTELKHDSLETIQKHVSEKLLGKIVSGYQSLVKKTKTKSKVVQYPNYDYKNGMFIGKVIKVECYHHPLEMPWYLPDGQMQMIKPIYVKVTCENGIVTDEAFNNGTNLVIMDDFLKFLEKNKGKEINFSGMKESDLINNIEKAAYTPKKRRSYDGGGLYNAEFTPKCKNYSLILQKIGVTSVKNVGDFITINDEYLFDYQYGYKFISKKISEKDPLGEEDWGDEDEEYQETMRKRLKSGEFSGGYYPEDDYDYDSEEDYDPDADEYDQDSDW